MLNPAIRKSAMTVAGLAALGLGGAAIAGAADKSSSSGSSSATRPDRDRPDRDQLTSDVAAKVKAAALDKVPGATVLRTESGGPYGSAYHAHVKTSDGSLKVVLVNDKFEATAVRDDEGRGGRGRGDHGGPGGHGRHGGGPDETPLTGDTKRKVEAAVLAKYSGATIERTETNDGDSNAPYESHIKTSAGKEFEVHVSKDLDVVDAREHPAHP